MLSSSNDRAAVVAKISRPRVNRPIARPRLFERLDQLRNAPLTWVIGPPGAGKTTLISSYLAERALAGLWYQLDAEDADPATFFYFLGLAVQQRSVRGSGALPSLTPEHLPGLASFTRRYAETIAARIALPAVIVLDNADQVPADAAFHEVLRVLAEALPQGLSLIVLSRSEPPAAYARLRLNETLLLLEAPELNLTADEARQLAAARETGSRPAPGADQLDRLLAQTGGWVAGFTLLLVDGGAADLSGLIGRSQQLLFDYFASELFSRLDPALRDALLRASLLPTMTVADAEHMAGGPAIGPLLAELHRRNCFCVQRGQERPVYEFHALFRAFLLDRAAAGIAPAAWRALQRRAADLLAGLQQADAAAALYSAAAHWSGLAALALREAPALVAAGRHRTLGQWLGGLPSGLFDGSPWLRYWRGVAELPFDPVAARATFERAHAGFRQTDDAAGLYSTWAGAMESFFYEWRDFTPADCWIAEFDALRARHPVFPSRAIELRTYWAMGTLLHRQPQHRLLPAWSQRVLVLLDPADLDLCVLLGGYLVIWFLWRGETLEAQAVIERIRPWTGPDMSPMVAILWSCGVGLFHSVQGDTAPCRAAIEAGLELARRTGLRAFDFLLNAQMARCCLIAGDAAAAQDWLAAMAGSMRSHSHIDGAFYRHLQSSAAAQRGDWQQALEHARGALAMAGECGVAFLQAHAHLDLARALIRRSGGDEAVTHLHAAQSIATAMGSPVLAALCAETEATAALVRGAGDDVTAPLLARALGIGHAMGGATWQMAGPQAAARLCDRALHAGIEVEHVRRTIRRQRLAPPEPATAADTWPFPIRLYTLGRFELLRDDEPLRWSGKAQHKPLELLKCLCALGGQAVGQDRVADLLWPDTDGDAADQALRTTLHRLRKLLRCDEAVRLEDRHLHLDPRQIWVDCLAFDRVAHHPAMADLSSLRRALDRYRGAFLPGESALWAQAWRERLRAQFVTMVDRLGALQAHDGDDAGRVDGYLRAIEAEPGVEGFYRALMHSYGRLGRRAEALAVYQRCRQSLLNRLGVSPAHETQALCRQLAES